MPILEFGKYKGTAIEDIPISYIQWMVENCKGASEEMAKNEIKRRQGKGITTKLSQQEWSEQMALLINKMPEGLKEQTVQYNGWEVKLRKL